MKKIYLDYAASTPVDPAVLRAMQPYFSAKLGNPGSLHAFGQEAITAVDRSRETIARAIGAEFREIIFTASATEANNLALRGTVKRGQRIIISAIEHESVLETARDLERDGVEVISLPINRQGIVDLKKLEASLNDRTALVSVMYANNEIGTIQPIVEIAKIMKEFRSALPLSQVPYPRFHSDAAQAFQFLDGNVQTLGMDMMTLSAHKIYGPKGAGALYIKNSLSPKPYSLNPLFAGGGQEFGLRSGTENVPAIVGFAKAVELATATERRESESKRIAKLRDALWSGIKKIYPTAEINGAMIIDARVGSQLQLPNILNVYLPGYAAQDLLTRFDLNGLAASSGSACRSRAMESSYVIGALEGGRRDEGKRAKSSIRFSLGRPTTRQEIAAALKIIKSCR